MILTVSLRVTHSLIWEERKLPSSIRAKSPLDSSLNSTGKPSTRTLLRTKHRVYCDYFVIFNLYDDASMVDSAIWPPTLIPIAVNVLLCKGATLLMSIGLKLRVVVFELILTLIVPYLQIRYPFPTIIIMSKQSQIKVIVVGDSGVGKSSILLRFVNDEFN